MRLSICIPTYNRAAHLENCLHSVRASLASTTCDVEVCVSDNASTDGTEAVVRDAQRHTPIKYNRNSRNLGIPRNFLNVVRMAKGEFVWLLGDDDLVVPDGIARVCRLITEHPSVDFFYMNSFHLTTEYVLARPQPFDTTTLPPHMDPFSTWTAEGELDFFDLIDPRVSFDFLGGMFLVVFRRANWNEASGALDARAIEDPRTFSSFDSTFPHVKIFARAFAQSKAYFNAVPTNVCLTGAREWAPMYPMVRTVRLADALREYRRNGLPLRQYLRCRNSALRTFVPDLVYMFLHRTDSGYQYVNPAKLVAESALYPNAYLSVAYYALRKAKALVARLIGSRTPLPQ